MPIKEKALHEFEFEDGGRKFFCTVEVPGQSGMPPWWWFRLNTEMSTRYAPFEAKPGDTKQSVQKRIIAYYAELQAIAARPAYQRPAWKKPESPSQAGEAVPALSPLSPPS